ncbi:MAG: dTDP-4-dehydrorhamnose 3,5-epimerase family protein [Acidobacteria bacterium]|nr:dTDP-4-dehydrorhamnose 3,5-epimerase family protein [Acidobacteriota bacterium]
MSENFTFAAPAHNGLSQRATRTPTEAHQLRGSAALPLGVSLRALSTHRDRRGSLTELFRAEWETGISPPQWNYAESEARVLRGVHAHFRHSDYLILLRGRSSIGLHDLREGSPTEGLSALVELRGEELSALYIPPGVAHGFYMHEPSIHAYAVSEYWDSADELGCHWADPGLGLRWPDASPLISERDAGLPPLSELKRLPLWRLP